MLLAGTTSVGALDTTDWLIERTSADAGTSGGRELPAITPDGRYVTFVGRGEGKGVWITDRMTDTTTHLTTGDDFNPAISDDGKLVAFVRYGSNRSVNIVEVATKKITLASVNSSGDPAEGLSDSPSLSANGRYVAFHSTATNLDTTVGDPGAGGGPTKVYVHDRNSGVTEMVSVNDTGQAAKGNAVKPDITPDGNLVVFASDADNLVAVPGAALAPADGEEEESEAVQHVYLHNRTTGKTEMISVDSAEVPGDAISGPLYGPTISHDGRYVAFESLAALVSDDTNLDIDAYVRDRTAGTTVRVSLNESGAQVDLDNPVVDPEDPEAPVAPIVGAGAAISGDGLVVAFESDAVLTADDLNGNKDPYLRDLVAKKTVRLGVAVAGGSEATGTRVDGHTGETVPQTNGYDISINRDGRYVSFVSNGDLAADRPVAEEEDHTDAALLAAVEEAEDVSTEPAVFTRTNGDVTLPIDENRQYVATLYNDLLGRSPDLAGLDYWTAKLDAGASRDSLVSSIVYSDEFLYRLVDATYNEILGRESEPGGRDYWIQRLASGMQWEDLQINLLVSEEYFIAHGSNVTDYVTGVYNDVLERDPDAAGLAFYVAAIENGASRIAVATNVVRSPEASATVVTGIYNELLDRNPEPAGLAFWTRVIGEGASSVTILRMIAASPEYYVLAQSPTPAADLISVFGS